MFACQRARFRGALELKVKRALLLGWELLGKASSWLVLKGKNLKSKSPVPHRLFPYRDNSFIAAQAWAVFMGNLITTWHRYLKSRRAKQHILASSLCYIYTIAKQATDTLGFLTALLGNLYFRDACHSEDD